MRRIVAVLVTGVVLAAAGALPASAQEEPDRPTSVSIEPAFDGQIWVSEVEVVVDGERVENAPVGRAFTLRLTFMNNAEESARDVVVRLSEMSEGWQVADPRVSLGDIAPGDTARATFEVTIPERPCEPFGGIGGTTASSLGEQPFKTGLGIDCPGPRLYATETIYRGGDDDGVPEPGERLEVYVVVYNQGRDPATNVSGRLAITAGDVEVIDGSATWPNIAPGASERNREPFVIKVADDADRAPECQPFVAEDLPAEGSDDAVSSDGTVVSSDGDVSGSTGGGTDGSAGQSEPGSAGSGSSTGTVEPEPAEPPADEPVKEDPPADEPVKEEPPDGGTTQIAPDEPRKDEPGEPRAGSDTPVPFEGKIVTEASGQTFELFVGSGVYCALAEGTGRDDLGAPAAGAPAFDEDAREVAAAKGEGRGPLAAVAGLALLAVGWALVRRRAAQRAAIM